MKTLSQQSSRTPDLVHPAITLDQFWSHAARSKLETRFRVAEEMNLIPALRVDQLRAIAMQYRFFTEAFATDLAVLVARCPASKLRSLLAELLNEELGEGDAALTHSGLYDAFLRSLGCFTQDATAAQLASRVAPEVDSILQSLSAATRDRSPAYAIGLRGMGGECVCGVYFGVMESYLKQHPYVIEHSESIDWRFWDIHAGHADVEHDNLVRAAIDELLAAVPADIAEVKAGYDAGTAAWEAFWAAVYSRYVGAGEQVVA